MKVLLIGSGGREHALAWKLAQSPQISQLYAAPGNPGIAQLGECVPVAADDIDGLLNFAIREQIEWTVVGPEVPLCAGIADKFREAGLKVFGPSKAAAALEGSKVFSKEFMNRHKIPTAPFAVFDSPEAIHDYASEHDEQVAVKVDGLAAGKGVFVCQNSKDLEEALDTIFVKKAFGEGQKVVVEKKLVGVETSFLVFSDGETALALEAAKDHKAAFDGDKGPNTGGMGTFCPAATLTEADKENVMKNIVMPTLRGMRDEGKPFQGILYVGLMLTKEGQQVLEYNVRFGDPEAQVILPRLKTDLIDIFEAAEEKRLADIQLSWDDRHALCVVLASEGYPGTYEKGVAINGLDNWDDNDVIVFHAGTKQDNGRLVTAGGRVLGVTALAATHQEACSKAYSAVERISWDGMYYRNDIGA
jgi:phosphoribosylamine---glycine ligase